MSIEPGANARPARRRRPRHRPATPTPVPARDTAAPARDTGSAPAVTPLGAPDAAADGGATTFAALGLPETLVGALARAGVTRPFPIQVAAVPSALAGRDVLGRGRTGSGKTLAFALPTVTRLTAAGAGTRRGRPRALVLVPTRELAVQVAETFQPLAAAAGLRVATVYGGVPQRAQTTALHKGVDVVVACPGRLEDLIGQRHCRLDAVEVTIVDEADHMADLGFLPAVRRLLDQTPPGTQRLLFSATLDRGVDTLVARYLDDPVSCTVEPEPDDAVDTTHHLFTVKAADKAAVVHELASGHGRSLLFTRTKHGAARLARQLTKAGIAAVDLHGNLTQGARRRNLDAFAAGTSRVLVATDIAARGIHVDDVALVVHVDPPADHKAFLHRSGRTARAGATGTVVTLATPEQASEARHLARQAGIRPLTASVAPGDDRTAAITGTAAAPAAPRSAPVPRSAPAAAARTAPGPRKGAGAPARAAGGAARRHPRRPRQR